MGEGLKDRLTAFGSFVQLCLEKIGLGDVRTILLCIWDCTKRLKNPFLLFLCSTVIFTIWSLHLYKSAMYNVCVYSPPSGLSEIQRKAFMEVQVEKIKEFDFDKLCGTALGAKACLPTYECYQTQKSLTTTEFSFDGFFESYISVLTIALLDYWEPILQMAMIAKGDINVLFFALLIFVSCILTSTFLAVVTISVGKIWKTTWQETTDHGTRKRIEPNNADDSDSENKSRQQCWDDGDKENPTTVLSEVKTTKTIVSSTEPHGPVDIVCGWECCHYFDVLRNLCSHAVLDPLPQIAIVCTLIINLVIITTDQDDMDEGVWDNFSISLLVFNFVYILEAALKIIALSPRGYFTVSWNIFEFVIVVLCIMSLVVRHPIMQIVRFFELFKFFRLARYWPSFTKLLNINGSMVKVEINFAVILLPFIFIMSTIGMETFGRSYEAYENRTGLSRWSMVDLFHSFMVVFRAICGEWVETFWECRLVSDWSCSIFLLAIVVIGKMLLINILTICMMTAMSKSKEKDDAMLDEAGTFRSVERGIDYMITLWNRMKRLICCRHQIEQTGTSNLRINEVTTNENHADETQVYVSFEDNNQVSCSGGYRGIMTESAGPCCPRIFSKRFPDACGSFSGWRNVREKLSVVSESRWFDYLVLVFIAGSSICLILEDYSLASSPNLATTVFHFKMLFKALFVIEMIIRLVAMGIPNFFQSGWRIFDLSLVVVALLDTSISGVFPKKFVQSILIFRIFRFFSLAWSFESSRVIANTLIQSFPGLINTSVMGWLLWTVFAVVGVQIFAGKFHECLDKDYRRLNATYVMDKTSCHENNHTWVTPSINFDNSISSFLALLQVATFKGWIDIIHRAMDSKMKNEQPTEEINLYMFLYFVYFIFFASYSMYVLSFSVLVDGYNRQRKESEIQRNLTSPGDVLYYKILSLISSCNPETPKTQPQEETRLAVFNFVQHKAFNIAVSIIIVLNLLCLSLVSHEMSASMSNVLQALDILFVVLLFAEVILRLVAEGKDFFRCLINGADAVILLLAIVSLCAPNTISGNVAPPMLLRLARLIVTISGINCSTRNLFSEFRLLVNGLKEAFSQIMFILALLFIVILVYAVIGMHLFKNLKLHGALDSEFNFQTFGNAIVVLCQLSVTSGWDGVLHSLGQEDDCYSPEDNEMVGEQCGHRLIGIAYCVTFIIIAYLILFTLLTVVVIQGYAQVYKNKEFSFGPSIDSFYKTWRLFDPTGTGYIEREHLSTCLDNQEGEFRVPNPNRYKIAAMDVPIVKGERVQHRDVLDALIRRALDQKGVPVENVGKFQDLVRSEKDYEPISTTLWRRVEENSARKVQKAWARHRERSRI